MASLRAVEQGRYLARAANTGISGVVDPYGRVIGATRVFEEAVVVVEVRFLPGRTLYATIGDLVAQLALVVAGLTVAVVWASSGGGSARLQGVAAWRWDRTSSFGGQKTW